MFVKLEIDDYFYGQESISNFSAASVYCQSYGTELASIHSLQDFYFAKIKCQEIVIKNGQKSQDGCWIGLNDRHVAGNYIWSDGTLSNFDLLVMIHQIQI